MRRKIAWFKEYYPKGLRIKVFISKKGGDQGMLEYIPGRYAHRPVDAEGSCSFIVFLLGSKRSTKAKGYASALIDKCIKEAKDAGMHGVAVVTRKGSFMPKKDIFLKKGFMLVDEAEPDFELLSLKFNQQAADPKFKSMSVEKYLKGLTVIRSAQCPYSVKNVDAILKTAEKLGIEADLVELEDSNAAQRSPCAFGTFCIIHDGEILSYNPISNTIFENIMRKKRVKG